VLASYRDKGTREVSEGKRIKVFAAVDRRAEMKLDQLDSAVCLRDLAIPGNRLEALKGEPQGIIQHPHQRSVAGVL
jgi:proteic killer suppression protein